MTIKIAVVGYRKNDLVKAARKYFKLDYKNPSIVIAYGGDGTFLYAEQKYPGIPKLLIKHPKTCIKCEKHNYPKILKLLSQKKYKIIESTKIEAKVNNKKLIGLNEINIHYVPPKALRYDVYINDRLIENEIIGDGLIIATPYGSTAYYKSIARKTFDKGFGIAYNNPTKPIKARNIQTNSKVKVIITRGPGVVSSDCNKKIIPVYTGDVVKVKKSGKKARLIQLKDKKLKYRL